MNRNLYDLTNEELKEKLNNEFNENYNSYNYSEENWKLLNEILEQFNNSVLETSFALALFNETRYKLSQVEKLKKEPSMAEVIVDKFLNAFSIIGKGVATVFNTISFVFSIFALTFASVVITLFIHLLLGTFIYAILPYTVTPLMVQSIIAAVIFIILKTSLFVDKDDRDVTNNPVTQIGKFALTIPFYCLIFLIFKYMDKYPVLEEIFPAFYPHMWLSSFTGEYVYSSMISLVLNCLISIVIYLIIRKKSM